MITLAIFQIENIMIIIVEPQYLERQYLKYHGYVEEIQFFKLNILKVFYLHISNPFYISKFYYLCQKVFKITRFDCDRLSDPTYPLKHSNDLTPIRHGDVGDQGGGDLRPPGQGRIPLLEKQVRDVTQEKNNSSSCSSGVSC